VHRRVSVHVLGLKYIERARAPPEGRGMREKDWWGFDRWEEAGLPLNENEICEDMNFEQTVTDVIKIRLKRTFDDEFRKMYYCTKMYLCY
jgi:hypothetical protein